jgi:hypothetical protein
MSKLKPLSDPQVQRTTIEGCLLPTVDSIRQIYTDFGLRPYRVFMVWVGWSADVNADGVVAGAERWLEPGVEGVGRPVLLKEVELLPTPLVGGLGGLSGDVEATGNTESGTVNVSQVSAGYTEDQLQGLVPPYRDPTFPDTLKKGVSFFYEIQENRPGGFRVPGTAAASQFPVDPTRSPRRRFHLTAAPSRQADAFQWTLSLARADGERGRNGEVSAVQNAIYVDDDEDA